MQTVKIGLMGGTFNPIHNGHLLLAEAAKEQYHLDHVVFLPARKPPHKLEKEILPDKLRFELTQKAVRDNSDFSVSSIELERLGVTYTADTLEILSKKPDLLLQGNDSGRLKELLSLAAGKIDFYFIIGGDSLLQFASWKSPAKILRNAVILASGRAGVTASQDPDILLQAAQSLEKQFGGRIDLIKLPQISISSSDIREKLKHNQSIRYLLPEEVRIQLLQEFDSKRG
ncbi:MAG: nicotinate-nucleotide adenylyltransferase [Clostridiales bacterium]|nr:nicotinate-nucleotide adenylyltransferase [Clostridiales bacterium]